MFIVLQVEYLGLDHVLTVQAEVEHAAIQVDGSFRVQLLQDPIQSDEGAGAADSSTDTQTAVSLGTVTQRAEVCV